MRCLTKWPSWSRAGGFFSTVDQQQSAMFANVSTTTAAHLSSNTINTNDPQSVYVSRGGGQPSPDAPINRESRSFSVRDRRPKVIDLFDDGMPHLTSHFPLHNCAGNRTHTGNACRIYYLNLKAEKKQQTPRELVSFRNASYIFWLRSKGDCVSARIHIPIKNGQLLHNKHSTHPNSSECRHESSLSLIILVTGAVPLRDHTL